MNEGILFKCIFIKWIEIFFVEECVFFVVKYEVKVKNL